MKEFLKLRRDRRKMQKIGLELKSSNLQQFIGKRIKITKKYADWVHSFGEEVGMPYNEMDYIRKKPKGKIINARYDGYTDGFMFTVKLDNGQEEKVGIEDIDIIEDKK